MKICMAARNNIQNKICNIHAITRVRTIVHWYHWQWKPYAVFTDQVVTAKVFHHEWLHYSYGIYVGLLSEVIKMLNYNYIAILNR